MLEIEEARRKTKEAQLARMEKQTVRGRPYEVGDLVRMKLDSAEVLKRGKKMAFRYSGIFKVVEVLSKGWTYRLKPVGWKGREKVRHFNDLKDVKRGSTNSDSESSVGGFVEPHKQKKKVDVSGVRPEPTTRTTAPEKRAHDRREPQVAPDPLRRSGRNRRNPERLMVTDMKAKKYDDVREIITEISSEDEQQSEGTHDSFCSVGSEVDESSEVDSSADC